MALRVKDQTSLEAEKAKLFKRKDQLDAEAGKPAAKKMCSTMANIVRKIAVEGNIGKTYLRVQRGILVIGY